MAKVQLPKVEDGVRAELNIIKAKNKDKSISDTIEGLIESDYAVRNLTENNNLLRTELFEAKKRIRDLEEVKLDLTYEEVEALVRPALAVEDSFDGDYKKNWKSGAQKLYGLMEKMKEGKELK